MRSYVCRLIALTLLATAPLAYAAPAAAPAAGGATMPPKAPAAATGKPAVKKPVAWMTSYQLAQVQAIRQDKIMLLYFSGSDWDDWTMKLEKEVLQTPLFVDWVTANVIPVNIDFAKDKKISQTIKTQNDKLKVEFQIAKVPTFLFVDPGGNVLARVGYDTARLRDEEAKDEPKAWVAFCDDIVKNRPPPDVITPRKDLDDAVKFVKSNGLPLLILITQNPTDAVLKDKEQLLKNLAFARFVNRNMAFVEVKWPADHDKTVPAETIRQFMTKWKIGPAPIKLAVWDPGGLGEVKEQITNGVASVQANPLIKRLDATLPRIDYGGGWIEDYKKARAIAHQQPNRDIILAFVRNDGTSAWSDKVEQEIFQTKEFRDFTSKDFILVKLDYPTKPDPKTGKVQDEKIKEQNRMLADLYGIRGYPTIVVLNNIGQKIGTAVYNKGGPLTFLPEIDKIRKADRDRRILPSMEEAARQ